jgi:hypothetical protein
MRTVEVFEISRRVKRQAGPFVEFVQTLTVPVGDLHPTVRNKFPDEVVHHEHGPVEAVVLPDGSQRFLAIQPNLRDLLDAAVAQKYEQKVRDLKINIDHARAQWMAEQKRAHRLLWRQEKFKTLPLWRRLALALNAQLPEVSDA